MKKLTLFTWGYYGWGNHTRQLVEAVDAVEASRGFDPPMFVDIRIHRSVRAPGFRETAFEKLLGQDRHRWMKSLGNKNAETKTGPKLQVAEPAAADELLDLALESARHNRRILFFCGCQWPRRDGILACHRTEVARLVLKAAKKRGLRAEVVEWPGVELQQFDVELEMTPREYTAALKGRQSIPLDPPVPLADFGGLPWCSIATLDSAGDKLYRLVGPVIYQKGAWTLPVMFWKLDPAIGLSEYKKKAKEMRKEFGLEPVSS